MLHDIEITIAGPAGKGKSAIAALIERTLSQSGLLTSFTDDNDSHGADLESFELDRRLDELRKQRTDVHISTIRTLNEARKVHGKGKE